MRKDVSVEANMLIISFRFSKTIQFGERILQTPLIEIEDSILYPVKAFFNMFKSIQINGEDPSFSLSNKKCIWYSQYQAKLKGLIKKNRFES